MGHRKPAAARRAPGGGDPRAERSPGEEEEEEEGGRGHARAGGRGLYDPNELSPQRRRAGTGGGPPAGVAAHTRGARRVARRRGHPGSRVRSPGRRRPRARVARGAPWALGAPGASGGPGRGRRPCVPPPPGGPAARGRTGGGGWLYISPHAPPGRAQRPEPRRLPAPLPALRGGGGGGSGNMAVDGCSGWRWRREELPRAPAPAARC